MSENMTRSELEDFYRKESRRLDVDECRHPIPVLGWFGKVGYHCAECGKQGLSSTDLIFACVDYLQKLDRDKKPPTETK